MTDPLIAKILYGLIVTSLISVFIVALGYGAGNKARELAKAHPELGSKAGGFGMLVYLLIVVVWYIGLAWYWFSLLGQIE